MNGEQAIYILFRNQKLEHLYRPGMKREEAEHLVYMKGLVSRGNNLITVCARRQQLKGHFA